MNNEKKYLKDKYSKEYRPIEKIREKILLEKYR